MRTVVMESPFAGDVEDNTRYALACLRDCLERGEAPMAGHLLYTRVLDDDEPRERELGINAHIAWIHDCEAVVVYENKGISRGMRLAIDFAESYNKLIEYRKLDGGW